MKALCSTGIRKSSSGGTDSPPHPPSRAVFLQQPDTSSSSSSQTTKTSLWSAIFSAASPFSGGGSSSSSSSRSHGHGWAAAMKRIVSSGSMRRLQERMLGGLNNHHSKNSLCVCTGDLWLLGVCYRISLEDSSAGGGGGGGDPVNSDGFAGFLDDFSSRILFTYRKGFASIGDTKYTSDVYWGCMVRSSQMLVAQALLFHRLGRSWRKPLHKPLDQDYIEILHLFGDSGESAFSIHNLLQAGKGYDLAAGSWVGPYAMCRTWETLIRSKREEGEREHQLLPMAIYVVSGDEDGERGGAPVVCIEDASIHCLEFSRGQVEWTPLLLLVPLVLGLDKINPRYLPLLADTFTFSQSLGILGGKPGASTYIVGLQEEKAFYLDPHEVQLVADIRRDNLDADTSSYHCNLVRQIPLDSLDPSLAIGFYCRDKDEFDDFCDRASKLAEQSNGAPLFTVTHARNLPNPACQHDILINSSGVQEDDSCDMGPRGDTQEDDWQLL